MSEPTIDEMLAALDVAANFMLDHSYEMSYYNAIRAILEQHRDGLCFSKMKWQDEDLRKAVQESRVECIRAFVERVEKRVNVMGSSGEYPDMAGHDWQWWEDAIRDEFAAMEKEGAAK